MISLLLTTALGSAFPTASIMLCGGFIMALKFLIPNIPKLDTVKFAPLYSSEDNSPFFAFYANNFTSIEISSIPLLIAFLTIGVIKPSSTATATDIS